MRSRSSGSSARRRASGPPRALRVSALALFLAGCAALGPTTPPDALEEQGFAVQGRLGVRHGDEGFSSNFVWHQLEERYEIEFWGPLGRGRTRLTGDESGMTIETAQGEVHREPDTATAMYRWLGMAVPVDALRYWIRGREAPGFPVAEAERDGEGNLLELEQLSWRLTFSEYGDTAENGHAVPARIVASHGDSRISIIAREWAFAPEADEVGGAARRE